MNKNSLIYLLLVVSFLMTTGCSSYYRVVNKRLVDRLNSQIQSGNYEQIYDESSPRAKDYEYSKAEFVERMQAIAEKMREVDESLTLQEHKGEYPYADESTFPPSQYAYRYVEKNERRIGINVFLDAVGGTLKLLDFCIYSEDDSDFGQLCVSDASKS